LDKITQSHNAFLTMGGFPIGGARKAGPVIPRGPTVGLRSGPYDPRFQVMNCKLRRNWPAIRLDRALARLIARAFALLDSGLDARGRALTWY